MAVCSAAALFLGWHHCGGVQAEQNQYLPYLEDGEVDGVCYVSLDENFKNQDYQVNEAVVIYSIVDSLTELSTISKVQISVNGDTSGTYRDNFKLSDMYDRNLDYVVSLEETGVTEEE